MADEEAIGKLVAAAHDAPGFGDRLATVREAVRTGSLDGSVPIEEVVPDWRVLLDGTPGAHERAIENLADAREGETIPLEDL